MTADPTGATGPDASDDYGYDLAHEAKASQAPAATRRPAPTRRDVPRRLDAGDGDLGYDEAHDL